METTQPDPVIAEVRAMRDELTKRADYDVGVIFRRIRQMQDESGREYVSYPARRIAESSDEPLAV